jgi:hypothetical protein
LQKPQGRNKRATRKNVGARFLPSLVSKYLFFGTGDGVGEGDGAGD